MIVGIPFSRHLSDFHSETHTVSLSFLYRSLFLSFFLLHTCRNKFSSLSFLAPSTTFPFSLSRSVDLSNPPSPLEISLRFESMSEAIVDRIDDMGKRIDELEGSISELLVQAGVEDDLQASEGSGTKSESSAASIADSK